MLITLRRAAAVQTALREEVARLPIATNVRVSVFTDVETALSTEQAKIAQATARRELMLDALFEIRKAVAAANASEGVSDLLAEQARNALDVELLTTMANATPCEPLDVTRKRATRAAERQDTNGYRNVDNDTIVLNVLSAEATAAYGEQLREAQRRKTNIADKLAAVNARAEIKLSDKTTGLLKELKLV